MAPTSRAASSPASDRGSPTRSEARGRLTIAATGDLLVHLPVAAQAKRYARGTGFDFSPMLASVGPLLTRADLAVCHLETPLAADGRRISGYPVFNTPHELAEAVRDAGYDSCSTASNHALDQSERGVKATLDALDRVGVGHAGTARSAAEAARHGLHDVGGVRIALLAYTYGLNGFTPPAHKRWLVNLTDMQRIRDSAAAARRAGAQFVVISMHWGNEYQVSPTPEQRNLARALLASPDIDLILGAHAHVVQPIEKIGSKYVVYGMGNFLSNQSARCCHPASQDGVIVTVTVRRDHHTVVAERVGYTPTWVDIGSYRVLPVAAALDDPRTPSATRIALQASWRRTTTAISSLHPPDLQPTRHPTSR
jgi:poly-gamma-glutamate synthesis protein (capsule biosynthesis protein)